MSNRSIASVALVWRPDHGLSDVAGTSCASTRRLVHAMHMCGLATVEVAYREDDSFEIKRRLREVDAVLVWVNPIQDNRSRVELDSLLRETSERGIWVSAHPDMIAEMGTKEILFRTRALSWDADTCLYRTDEQLRRELPARLASGTARVLKQNRGNNGIGVWKVESVSGGRVHSASILRVQRAHPPASRPEQITFDEFADQLQPCFTLGPVIDQAFQRRLADGLIRAYFVGDELVGFCHQRPRGLLDHPADEPSPAMWPAVFTMEHAAAPTFRGLGAKLKAEWLPGLISILGLEASDLPAIWDADFFFAEQPMVNDDQYVLCEINVSAVWPFPVWACDRIARMVRRRITGVEKDNMNSARSS